MAIKKMAGRISPVFMGDYDNTTVYRRLDWVYYGGTSYICKKSNTTGIAPSDTEKWQKIIELPTELDMIFEEAATRENIASGDKLSVVLGKIKKWYSELKTVAFTGKFTDLVDSPIKITDNSDNTCIYLGQSERVMGLENQLHAVNFRNEGDGPNQGMRFITRQPSSGDIIFGDIAGDTDLKFPFSFGINETGDYGYKKYKSDKLTPFGNVYSVNNKTGAITLSATDVKAIPVNNRIEKLTDINEITSIGFWTISAIDSNYASSIGIDNNTGDFYALVLNYNGNGTNAFIFGTIILSSPRFSIYHYQIQVWEGVAQAVKILNNQNILNTTEQISANTNNLNLAGALALKAAIADYTNKISAINSNLATINATGLTKIGAVPWKDIIITNSGRNAVVFFSNWTGEKCFPENYGSGIILPCVDVTHKRILYIGRSGKLYTGFFFASDKDNITWYS